MHFIYRALVQNSKALRLDVYFLLFGLVFLEKVMQEMTYFQVCLSLSSDIVRCAFSKKLLKKKKGRVEQKFLSHTHLFQREWELLAQG